VPDQSTIQAAYDRVEQTGSKLHDKGLQIVAATCNANGAQQDTKPTGRYLCQVTFLSRDDPNQRLYFDIVAVDLVDGRWELTSALCKR
jgi:hypothetical protein